MPTKLPTLVWRFHQDVVTDLSLNQSMVLICMLQTPQVTTEHLQLDAGLVTAAKNDVLEPDTARLTEFIETAFMP